MQLVEKWRKDPAVVTIDVTSLYPNIDPATGVDCVKYYLEHDPEILEPQKSFLLEAL